MCKVRNLKNSPFNTQKLMEAEALDASRQTSGNESANPQQNQPSIDWNKRAQL
jgi:hypothetical protein